MGRQTGLSEFHITEHARLEMLRRQITEEDLFRVLLTPEQILEAGKNRLVYQPRYDWGAPVKTYLLRVFVDIDRQPPTVVTVYRTSKVDKYLRGDL